MMRLYMIGGLSVLVVALMAYAWNAAKQSGRDAVRLEQSEVIKRKLKDATIADDANTRCLADPSCRLSDDGFRRD